MLRKRVKTAVDLLILHIEMCIDKVDVIDNTQNSQKYELAIAHPSSILVLGEDSNF